jgi:hypothetical protein
MFPSHLRLGAALAASALLALATAGGGCASNTTREGYADAGPGMTMYGPDSSVQITDSGINILGETGSLTGDGGVGSTLASGVYFDPPSANIMVGNTPAVVNFKLMAKNPGYPDMAVAPTMAVFNRPDLAAMTVGNPVVLTASGVAAGDGTLQGVYGGRVASAPVHVSVHLSNTGTGIDPSAPAALDGATAPDPAVTSLLYPYDKTVFPLGLTSPLVMWNAPKAGDVYKLSYTEKDFTCDDYEVVPAKGQLRIDQKCWDALTSSNQGDPVQVTLSRWDAGSKTAYVSAKQTWPLAKANMQGAIYYWTAAGDSQEDAFLARLRTGAGATPEAIYDQNGAHTCMACHAVSADGKTLVAVAGDGMSPSPSFPGENTNGGPPTSLCATAGTCEEDFPTDYRAWISFDITQAAPYAKVRTQSNYFGGNVAVNPDGKYTVFGDVTLFVADTATGMAYPNSGLDNVALDPTNVGLMMPAFSPKGNHLAAVEGPPDPSSGQPSYISLGNDTASAATAAKLVQLDFDEASHTFSNKKALAPESGFPAGQQAIAYPTYSPDESWIAFHVGDKPTACEDTCLAEETSAAAIYLQNTSGAAPIRLTTLTDTPTLAAAQQNHSFEPTFNPIERGGYFWVVFSSERDWGNEIQVGGAPNNGNKRLWIAAVDGTPGTGDPSHPPFFVEGQDEGRLNMRGFWALAQCIDTGQGTCMYGYECCSGYCDQGICFMPGGSTCVPIGSACNMTSDCCNAPLVQCINGICGTLNQ